MNNEENPVCYDCDQYYELSVQLDIFICPCCKDKFVEDDYDY